MVELDLPEVPAPLRGIQHYLKIAATHDQRDPIVSYWCRLYAFQTGLKVTPKTSQGTLFLSKLMDWLEATKKEMADNEAITNDVAAQAHLENWALKLFLYADKNDRASNFGKNVIQSFFTAGMLYDILTMFGELSEEATQNRKYAKWKATYIHNCLKNGETPVPGPIDNPEGGEENTGGLEDDNTHGTMPSIPVPQDRRTSEDDVPSLPKSNPYDPSLIPPTSSQASGSQVYNPEPYSSTPQTEDGAELTLEHMDKARKFIKWAGSALNYDDVPTAVENLRKALHLLTTGQEPA